MIFSSTQAFLAMKTGATLISIVLSRLDNIANESYLLIEDAVTIKQNYGYPSQILTASLKTQNHVLNSLRAGADIITIPESLFFQMFNHPLTDQGLAEFDKAWQKI
jgi:transaldolase